jgi:hypothetical protein
LSFAGSGTAGKARGDTKQQFLLKTIKNMAFALLVIATQLKPIKWLKS